MTHPPSDPYPPRGGGPSDPGAGQAPWDAGRDPRAGQLSPAAPGAPSVPYGAASPTPGYGSSAAGYGSPAPGYGSPASSAPGAHPGSVAPGGTGGPFGPGGSGGPAGPGGPFGPGGPGGSSGGPVPPRDPGEPAAPNLINGATVHGILGRRGIRHPWELPLLGVGVVITLVAALLWILATLYWIFQGPANAQRALNELGLGSTVSQLYVAFGLMALILWIARALGYAQQRAGAIRMSPTQFPEGYRMVAEAARRQGMRRVPDAYVQLGNGTINAFASGHGFRRFVVVYSDLFEVGGHARDPEALRFIIGHEVGHLAAGHVSYFRYVFTNLLAQIPILGPALSRAQEYTADNYGYDFCPSGSAGTMAVLGAGKYLNADVNVNELADRAPAEKGLWLHIVNWLSSHPILTWRAYALRDRRRPGKIWFRPGSPLWPGTPADAPMFRGPLPAGSVFSGPYPTPEQAIRLLDEADAVRPAGSADQWGRFPGVDYADRPAVRTFQTSAPLLSRPWGEVPRFGPDDGPGGHGGAPGGYVPQDTVRP